MYQYTFQYRTSTYAKDSFTVEASSDLVAWNMFLTHCAGEPSKIQDVYHFERESFIKSKYVWMLDESGTYLEHAEEGAIDATRVISLALMFDTKSSAISFLARLQWERGARDHVDDYNFTLVEVHNKGWCVHKVVA